MDNPVSEFELIKRCFAPLASSGAPAFGLKDDAAIYTPSKGCDLVFTKDAMVAGVHFFADDDPAAIARKLIRVNLSDLAAMGAVPKGYLLAFARSADCGIDWIDAFATGLAADQKEFDFHLFGGDTVSTPGPLMLSLTAIGEVEHDRALSRSGARAGDYIYCSGTLGDSALGLKCRRGEALDMPVSVLEFLTDRYLIPQPRILLGQHLIGVASSAMDISDGLPGDIRHILQASGVGASIWLEHLPVSWAARVFVEKNPDAIGRMRAGGDDYELLFTAPELSTGALSRLQKVSNTQITAIGKITPGDTLNFLDQHGNRVDTGVGYQHF